MKMNRNAADDDDEEEEDDDDDADDDDDDDDANDCPDDVDSVGWCRLCRGECFMMLLMNKFQRHRHS